MLKLSLIVATEGSLLFIKKENMNSFMTNNFFCCNVKNSRILTWEVNGVGIGNLEYLEDVITGNRSNFTYFSNFLSMSSSNGVKSITNLYKPLNTENYEPIRNASVNMQPVFLTNSILVNDGNDVNTKAFICDANNTDVSWEADSSNTTDHLALNSNSLIGASDSRLTDSKDTLRLQAI